MDKMNYDPNVIAVFDHIGSFFVDIFYNSLYLKARESVNIGESNSITEAYRNNIKSYMIGIREKDILYKKVIKNLHQFYQKSSGFGVLVFTDFENKVLSQFIPEEYYKDFVDKYKEQTLHYIIVNSICDLGELILGRDIFKKIIDDHKNIANVSLLQDKFVNILINYREEYHIKFVQEINKSANNDKISKIQFNKLKDAFINEKKLRCKSDEDRNRAVNMISQLVEKIRILEKEIEDLQSRQRDAKYTPIEDYSRVDIPSLSTQYADMRPETQRGANPRNVESDSDDSADEQPTAPLSEQDINKWLDD